MSLSSLKERFGVAVPFLLFFLLLVSGVFVTLSFIGADGHLLVLVPNDVAQSIVAQVREYTGDRYFDLFYRGMLAFAPATKLLMSKLAPFLSYAIISGLLYGAAVLYSLFRRGRLYLECRLNALHIFGIFVLLVWLLATTLFYADLPGLQQRLHFEPTESTYQGASPRQMQVLKENFDRLQNGGCLTLDPQRKAADGASVYFYSGWCMQKSFVKIVLPPLLLLFMLSVIAMTFGRFLFWLARLRIDHPFYRGLLEAGVGFAGIAMLLWLLATMGSLNMRTAWGLLVLLPFGLHRFFVGVVTDLWKQRVSLESSFFAPGILLFWFLLSYLALNYLTVIRPFPIGWDDLGRYINGPRQMSVLGQIMPGMDSPKWEFITSLGFLLFGYGSTFGAVLAQQINWMAGALSIIAVYAVARLVLGKGRGLVAAALYYLLPMTGHYSFADMKTENALFSFGALGVLCVFLFLHLSHSSKDGEPQDDAHPTKSDPFSFSNLCTYLLFGGILLAAGFSTKPTIVLIAFMSGIILTYGMLGTLSGLGSVFLSVAVILAQGTLNMNSITQRIAGSTVPHLQTMMIVFMLCAGGILLCSPLFFQRSGGEIIGIFRRYLIAAAFLVGGFALFSAPWMMRNMAANRHVSVSAAIGGPNTITPYITYLPENIPPNAPAGSRALPPELTLDTHSDRCIGTSGAEELDRYWGYGDGIMHYIGLPWRLTMNLDSQGYYVTLSPLLLLVPLLLLFPAFWRRKYLRWLMWGTLFYVVVWVLVGNGIPWYGIGMFLGLAVFVEAFLPLAPDIPGRILAGTLIVVAFGTCLSLRMWQMDMQRNLFEYSWGKASHDVVAEMTIPDYDDVADRVKELSKNPETPFLYRMGTFITYFIPRSIEVIPMNDAQLEFFKCLNQEKDHLLTLRRIKALGFHSMVFDTNTATIERDPNGTLHKKVQEFIDFLNDPALGLVPIVNSPERGIIYVVLPDIVPEPPEAEAS